jgi:hypothetical protein
MSAAVEEQSPPCPECGRDCGGTIREVRMGWGPSTTGECARATRRRLALAPMPGSELLDERRAKPGPGLVVIDWDAPDEDTTPRRDPGAPTQDALVAWIAEHGESDTRVIAAHFGWAPKRASATAYRASRAGKLERVGYGRYRLAGGVG